VAEAREALARADAVFVGSAHIRGVLEEVVGHVERVHEVPPGVDVDEFTPKGRAEALAALLEECRRDPPNPGNRNERLPDEGNARRLERLFEGELPTVLYFGKLLYNKGVHLLVEALHGIAARAVIVGFGDYRQRLEELAPHHTLFTGPLEHRHLVNLLPLADVVVVPSIFPEAFGMVAAEGAACGVLPISAAHSGLAEVSEVLARAVPAEVAPLLSFPVDDEVVRAIAERVARWLSAEPALRAGARGPLVSAVRERWSWESVAATVIAAAEGRLEELAQP
jgi:glycosyltransferase involved in cell wall biosynthesis